MREALMATLAAQITAVPWVLYRFELLSLVITTRQHPRRAAGAAGDAPWLHRHDARLAARHSAASRASRQWASSISLF
jgi:hypothetical protein